jgi:hypothetical protein
MKYFLRPSLVVLSLIMVGSILTGNAYAYLDPGTGSYFLQVLLAAILGALFTLRIFWIRIVSYVKNIFSGTGKDRETTRR